jgi:predicted DNA-binding protein (UPF0251 family)
MDYEGLYQEECAERMEISRTTLSRTIALARRKVADALLNGKRLLVAPRPQPVSVTMEPGAGRSHPHDDAHTVAGPERS